MRGVRCPGSGGGGGGSHVVKGKQSGSSWRATARAAGGRRRRRGGVAAPVWSGHVRTGGLHAMGTARHGTAALFPRGDSD